MAFTMQNVVDRARIPLNDKIGTADPRFAELTLLSFAVDGLILLLSKRPDLYYGQFAALPAFGTMALANAFPLDDIVMPAVADYVTARAECTNDESVLLERAALFFKLVAGEI